MVQNQTTETVSSAVEEIETLTADILSYIDYVNKHDFIFATPIEELFYLAKYGFSIEDNRLFQLINSKDDLSLIRQGVFSNESHVDINTTDEYGNTLLHYLGASHHCCNLGAYLLHKGANANCVNHQGETPVKRNAHRLNAFAVPLIEATHFDNLHKIYNDGETILTCFAQEGRSCQLTDIILTCRNIGVDINQANSSGHTPLYYIIQRLQKCQTETKLYDSLSCTINDLIGFGAKLNQMDISDFTNSKHIVKNNTSCDSFIHRFMAQKINQNDN